MGFIASASTIVVTAKLTPYGRQQLLANTNSIISHFSLGDTDANYRATDELGYGDIPSSAGSLGVNGVLPNSVTTGVVIKNKILVDEKGSTIKPVEANSNKINVTEKKLGVETINESDMRIFKVNRTETSTDSLTNLYSSFGLPITDAQKTIFTTTSDAFGGLANTALNGLNQDKILVISVDTSNYGEMLDGRVLKLEIVTSAGTYNVYSTYQKSLTQLSVQDTKTAESTSQSSIIGNNIVFLFSDEIQKPNNNILRSWSTGFNTVKPFSVNNKQLFNITTNTANNAYADRAIGVAYLDKGIIVITEPSIVNNYYDGDSVDLTFDSLIHEVCQDITCIINRGEFSVSKNPTYNPGDTIRVSEVGLHDANGNLMAIAKPNKHLLIGANQFLSLGVKISV